MGMVRMRFSERPSARSLLSGDPDRAGADADGGERAFVDEPVDGGADDVENAGCVGDGELLFGFELRALGLGFGYGCLVPAVLALRAVASKGTALGGAVDLVLVVRKEGLPADRACSLFDLHRFLHFSPIFCFVARPGEPEGQNRRICRGLL